MPIYYCEVVCNGIVVDVYHILARNKGEALFKLKPWLNDDEEPGEIYRANQQGKARRVEKTAFPAKGPGAKREDSNTRDSGV